MVISTHWLIIVCLLAVIPAMIAIFYCVIVRAALNGAMTIIRHDIAAIKRDTDETTRKVSDCLGEQFTLTRKITDVDVFVHGVDQKLKSTEESIATVNNKLASRERFEKRALKREEAKADVTDEGQIPVEQQDLLDIWKQQGHAFPLANQRPVGKTGRPTIIHP
jgi:predicted nuclease with TOPRIM domain